jgi:hypothetical protein
LRFLASFLCDRVSPDEGVSAATDGSVSIDLAGSQPSALISRREPIWIQDLKHDPEKWEPIPRDEREAFARGIMRQEAMEIMMRFSLIASWSQVALESFGVCG